MVDAQVPTTRRGEEHCMWVAFTETSCREIFFPPAPPVKKMPARLESDRHQRIRPVKEDRKGACMEDALIIEPL